LSQGESIGSDVSSLEGKINSIEGKVSDIDNFFANNVEGYGSGAIPSQGNTAPPSNPSVDASELDLVGEPTLGSEDATVTVVEFSDYECPFCGRFYSESFGQLKEEYIDTGLVKFVFKDFPLSFHQNAKPASIAANCVQAQLGDEAYFEYHDVLFEGQTSLTASNLKTWAVDLGVNEAEYDSCIADPEMADEVDQDFAEGSSLGVSGTPSFFINGNLIVGAQPYSVIKQAIEAELN
jgi:protein-disulfide isomerase